MKKIVFVTLVLFAFACKPETDFSPRKVNFDRDICALCLMGVSNQSYSVQSINKWNKVIWFDDLGCFVNYKTTEDWKRFAGDAKVQSWIGDCETGKWIDVEKAFYRFGDRTPMGYGYGALSQANDTTYDYLTTVQRIENGESLRDSFMKMHKMKKNHSHNMEGNK